MITIIDTVGASGSVRVDKDDAAAAIAGWYPDATEAVTDALAGLQAAANRGEPTLELEAFLGIRIDWLETTGW